MLMLCHLATKKDCLHYPLLTLKSVKSNISFLFPRLQNFTSGGFLFRNYSLVFMCFCSSPQNLFVQIIQKEIRAIIVINPGFILTKSGCYIETAICNILPYASKSPVWLFFSLRALFSTGNQMTRKTEILHYTLKHIFRLHSS